jgi:hypothetical protein
MVRSSVHMVSEYGSGRKICIGYYGKKIKGKFFTAG